MKKVRFNSKVQVFPVPKHDECRFNEWIRRKIDFERRVYRLNCLLGPILQAHCLSNLTLEDSDSDFEIVFE